LICERASGSKVLDVGCSQGIASILIAREGKNVEGIDIDEESIQFANDVLLKESAETQKRIKFRSLDFFTTEYADGTFDTLIVSEVLEHLLDPDQFINKAVRIIRDKGTLLISVPFGINDAPDHKATHYGLLIVEMLKKDLKIVDNKVIANSWLCLECKKDDAIIGKSDGEIARFLENELYNRERAFINGMKTLENKISDANQTSKIVQVVETASRDTQALAAKLLKIELQLNNYKKIDQRLDGVSLDIENCSERIDLNGQELTLMIQNELGGLNNINTRLNDFLSQLNLGIRNSHDLLDISNKIERAIEEYQNINNKSLEYTRIRFDQMRNDLSNRDLTIESLRSDLKTSIENNNNVQLKNKELETKLNMFNPKYSKCLENYEKLKIENADIRTRLDALMDRFTKELKEEERILYEYSRMSKENDKLRRKNDMFEMSRTGKIVTFVWNVLNKIKGREKRNR